MYFLFHDCISSRWSLLLMDMQKGRSRREIWGLCYKAWGTSLGSDELMGISVSTDINRILWFCGYFLELPFYNQWKSDCKAVVTLETEKAEYAFWHKRGQKWHLNCNYRAKAIKRNYSFFESILKSQILKSQAQYLCCFQLTCNEIYIIFLFNLLLTCWCFI